MCRCISSRSYDRANYGKNSAILNLVYRNKLYVVFQISLFHCNEIKTDSIYSSHMLTTSENIEASWSLLISAKLIYKTAIQMNNIRNYHAKAKISTN